MIELHISNTCMFSTTGRNAGWQRYDDTRQSFQDLQAAKEWLRSEYGTARRGLMYCDRKDAAPLQCGYVIGFRNKYRNKGEPIMEQHWVEFRECAPLNLKGE